MFASAQVRDAIAITDDAIATKISRRIKKVEVHGSLWLLIKAYRNGKLNESRASEIVDALRARGARYPCDGAELFSWARSRNLLE